MEEKFGIENVKKLLLWGAKVANTVIEAVTDDPTTEKDESNIDVKEGIDISFKAITIPFKSFKFAASEIGDMSAEEKEEINLAFQEEFDITKEEAEVMVEQVIDFVLTLIVMFISKHEDIAEV